jgi:hypothetical protein
MRKHARSVLLALFHRLPLQFRVLYRVFLLRVVDMEILSADSDPTKLIGQIVSILCSVSFLFSFPFILGGFPRLHPPISWTIEHIIIATTMAVAGLFSVLTWDSIFPDRLDVLVLAPLPVRPRTLFLAKIFALMTSIELLVLALNSIAGIIFPLMLCSVPSTTAVRGNAGIGVWVRHLAAYWGYGVLGILHGLAAYWITILVAALFLFCSVTTIQGVSAQILPRQLFLRISALLQVALFCLILGTYFLEPSLESPRALAAPENQRLLACLPTYWFLGLFNQLNGTMHPAMAPLVHRAWLALAISVSGATVVMLHAYFRVMRKVVEQPDILPVVHRTRYVPHFGNPLRTALMLFSLRTVFRSRPHRVLLSFYFGVGLAMVLAYISTPLSQRSLSGAKPPMQIEGGFLIASILLLFLAIIGLRIVSTIPINLRANWIFRITQSQKLRDYLNATRVTWILLGAFPVCAVTAILLRVVAPWRQEAQHLLILALLGILLVELCLNIYRKIPFTCSYLPGKGNINAVFWVFLLFFLPLLDFATKHEQQLFFRPYKYLELIAVLTVINVGARYATSFLIKTNDDLIFEEEEPPILVSLKLT